MQKDDYTEILSHQQSFPTIYSVKITNILAEIHMEHMGVCFNHFQARGNFSTQQKIGIAFEMGWQILQALQVLHRAGYVHQDMKPDNICVKQTQDKKGKICYQFSLIDFGLIRRLKLSKTKYETTGIVGNVWFSSVTNLKRHQSRYQDDVESLLYIIYWFINDTVMPWSEIYAQIAAQSLK